MFERSDEGDTECLGLLPGQVRRLPESPGIRIPHMGWNRLEVTQPHALVEGLDQQWVYFVHSYAAHSAQAVATTTHGEAFTSVVASDRIMGAQFHPERSSAAGARLLKNFLAI